MSYQSRLDAINTVLRFVDVHPNEHEVTNTGSLIDEAERVNTYLVKNGDPYGENILIIRYGPIQDQTTHEVDPHPLERKNGMTALKDTQEYTFTVSTTDAKGFATLGDTVTATSADSTIASVTGPDATSGAFTVVAGNPGSTVITVSDGTITGTEAVDVTTGATASIVITPGAVTEQGAPTP